MQFDFSLVQQKNQFKAQLNKFSKRCSCNENAHLSLIWIEWSRSRSRDRNIFEIWCALFVSVDHKQASDVCRFDMHSISSFESSVFINVSVSMTVTFYLFWVALCTTLIGSNHVRRHKSLEEWRYSAFFSNGHFDCADRSVEWFLFMVTFE